MEEWSWNPSIISDGFSWAGDVPFENLGEDERIDDGHTIRNHSVGHEPVQAIWMASSSNCNGGVSTDDVHEVDKVVSDRFEMWISLLIQQTYIQIRRHEEDNEIMGYALRWPNINIHNLCTCKH